MKWLVGMTLVIAILGLSWLAFDRGMPQPRTEHGSIRVVAGVDRSMPIVARPPMGISSPATVPPPAPEETTIATPDMVAIAALFEAQVRDPSWAYDAEADVRSHISGGDVRCAEFMCRIAMPLPDRSMSKSADQQAETVAGRWWPNLPYNHLTATIARDRQTPTLIFYVTKTSNDKQAS